MSFNRTLIAAPAITSWANLANALWAGSAAVAVGTTNSVVDHEIQVTITGPATMTAAATTQVNVYVYGSADGTTWPGSSTTNETTVGTDAAITISANGNNATLLGVIPVTLTTAGVSNVYRSAAFSLKTALGLLPSKYAIAIQNLSSAALNATGHSIVIEEIYYA